MERADVVVVGAGLAGLQCARLAAQRGWRVIVIDRKISPSQFVHTTGIFVRRTFEDFLFPSGTLGAAIRRVIVHSPAGRTAAFESSRDEFRIGRMAALYDAMLERSAAEFRGGLSFVSVEPGRDDAVVTVRRGRATQRIRARFVVGADGASSRVAQALGLAAPRRFLVGVEEIYVPAHRARRPPALHCFIDPRLAPGYLGWIADDGEELHAGAAGIEKRFDAPAAIRQLRRLVMEHLGADPGAPIERRGGRIPVAGISSRIASRHGLLVGDAAGAVSPLTAGGLDAALRLSAFAAEAVDRALRGEAVLTTLYSGRPFRARFLSRLWMRTAFERIPSFVAEAGVFLLASTPLHRLGERIFFGHGSFPLDSGATRLLTAPEWPGPEARQGQGRGA